MWYKANVILEHRFPFLFVIYGTWLEFNVLKTRKQTHARKCRVETISAWKTSSSKKVLHQENCTVRLCRESGLFLRDTFARTFYFSITKLYFQSTAPNRPRMIFFHHPLMIWAEVFLLSIDLESSVLSIYAICHFHW